jgi:hypothetical protein
MKPRRLCIGQRGSLAPVPEFTPEVAFPEKGVDHEPEIGIERHYSPAQIAKALNLSDTKIRRIFEKEPGVAKIGEPSRRLGRKLKRRYYTLRIPESVALRVLSRMRNR